MIWYLVMSVTKTANASTIPPAEMKISWADGMIGACPVFDNMPDAETYANGKARIYAVEAEDTVEQVTKESPEPPAKARRRGKGRSKPDGTSIQTGKARI